MMWRLWQFTGLHYMFAVLRCEVLMDVCWFLRYIFNWHKCIYSRKGAVGMPQFRDPIHGFIFVSEEEQRRLRRKLIRHYQQSSSLLPSLQAS
jgi:hypothetical protein